MGNITIHETPQKWCFYTIFQGSCRVKEGQAPAFCCGTTFQDTPEKVIRCFTEAAARAQLDNRDDTSPTWSSAAFFFLRPMKRQTS